MHRNLHIATLIWLGSRFVVSAANILGNEAPNPVAVRSAIEKSLPLMQASGEYSRTQRRCFTCHHVGHVALAVNSAWQRGFPIDEGRLKAQVDRTQEELKSELARFMQGRFPHGKGDEIGLSAWLLRDVGWPADETTTDMLRFLVGHDQDRETWQPDEQRPPTVGSYFGTTFVVLQALTAYRSFEVGVEIRRRSRQSIAWLLKTPSFDNEDMVYRLRALHLVDELKAAREEGTKLLRHQREEDGGWAQLPQLNSDPYATATALAALIDTGISDTNSTAFRRGVDFLLRSQRQDGSWHVASRTTPRQPFYSSAFPHGKDQFISVSATAWATYALLKLFPSVQSRAESKFWQHVQ